MKLSEIIKKNSNLAHSLASSLFGVEAANMNKSTLATFLKKNDADVYMEPFETVDELVHRVNKMVKHESCPNNLKNRFYTRKHKWIRERMRRGDVDHVLESENLYHFFFKNGRSYHQLKSMFPSKVKNITGTEEYKSEDAPIPFVEDDFKRAMQQMSIYISNAEYLSRD